GLALDARAAVRWLRDAGFPGSRVIYVGESLGTGVLVRLATTDPPAALLLRSPYTSMVAVARNQFPWLPVGLLMSDRFDTMSRIPHVAVPITVLAGGLDDLVPPAQSAAVADAAPNLFRHVEVPDAGHNDTHWYGPDLAKQVDDLAGSAIRD
ncbi:MAG: alpha/beta hydrolase, partial [Gammaproteobacteria bacterium]|nr:alpha/beta hydrolase [Gammaproteobacteria bacterium]